MIKQVEVVQALITAVKEHGLDAEDFQKGCDFEVGGASGPGLASSQRGAMGHVWCWSLWPQ
eukprot:3300784-Pyramimonas_sp.AAC.1